MLHIVTNTGKTTRLLGPKLGSIKPAETRFFEGDDAVELERVVATPEFLGIVNKPSGLRVVSGQAAIAEIVSELEANPEKIASLGIGAAVEVIASLKAQGNDALLQRLKPFADKPQLREALG